LGAICLAIKWLLHETDPSLPSSAKVKDYGMELYHHSPIHLHVMMLNYLSTGDIVLLALPYHHVELTLNGYIFDIWKFPQLSSLLCLFHYPK
jgi:hypothetical protein